MWDERYRSGEYAYGKDPNQFLRERYGVIPVGRVLSLAEGEGRNAVFLAQQGFSVTAVDSSTVGLSKAKILADERGVELTLIQADLNEFDVGFEQWDGIVSIFCPLPAVARTELYRKVVRGLKPNGVFVLEAYTPKQLMYKTGGGNSAELMTTKESLVSDLKDLTFIHLEELDRPVIEGSYHTGVGAVVQLIAVKMRS